MRYSKPFFTVLFLTLFLSCSKKSSTPTPTPSGDNDAIGLTTGTLSRIITIDYSTTKYKYLWLDAGGGYIYRTDVDKTYSFTQLAADKDCKWKVQSATTAVYAAGTGPGTLDNEEVILRSSKNDSYYWGISKGASVSGAEEWMLTTFYNSSRPSPIPDYLRFILHKQADQNGVHAYKIESKFKPGFYLVNSGHAVLANGIRMQIPTTTYPATIFEFH